MVYTTPRSLRYNAKTSISTRYPNEFAGIGYLHRNTDGALVPDHSLSTKPKTLAAKPTKKHPRQEDLDYIDEPESSVNSAMDKAQAQSSMLREEYAGPSTQLLREFLSTCAPGTTSSIAETTYYIFACNLQCKPHTLPESESSPSRVCKKSKDHCIRRTADAPKVPARIVHWHIHTHMTGRRHCNLKDAGAGPVSNSRSVCFDVQLLQGALARMKMKKSWPADIALLKKFYRTNGNNYELEILPILEIQGHGSSRIECEPVILGLL